MTGLPGEVRRIGIWISQSQVNHQQMGDELNWISQDFFYAIPSKKLSAAGRGGEGSSFFRQNILGHCGEKMSGKLVGKKSTGN
jgi:hypothetical protein